MVRVVENPPANAGDVRDRASVSGLRRSPGGAHDNPLQYSCLENPMDRRAWQAIVHGVAKSLTWLQWFSTCSGRRPLFYRYCPFSIGTYPPGHLILICHLIWWLWVDRWLSNLYSQSKISFWSLILNSPLHLPWHIPHTWSSKSLCQLSNDSFLPFNQAKGHAVVHHSVSSPHRKSVTASSHFSSNLCHSHPALSHHYFLTITVVSSLISLLPLLP